MDNETFHSLPVNGKFNILTCHTRYRPNTMNFLYNDTVRITFLRNTPENFRSRYYFYGFDIFCNMSFGKFLKTLPNTSLNFTRINRIENEKKVTVNQMCYDLGLSNDYPNDTTIQNFIQFVDTEFDFVMIFEYYDVSLILLADLMSWPLEYVVYLPLLKRTDREKNSGPKLTAKDKINLRELNRADSLLYDFFLEKFRQRIIQYGAYRLMKNLRKFRKLNYDLRTKCVSEETEYGFVNTVGYKLKDNSTFDCVHAVKEEMNFLDELRQYQAKQISRDKKILDLILE